MSKNERPNKSIDSDSSDLQAITSNTVNASNPTKLSGLAEILSGGNIWRCIEDTLRDCNTERSLPRINAIYNSDFTAYNAKERLDLHSCFHFRLGRMCGEFSSAEMQHITNILIHLRHSIITNMQDHNNEQG